MTDNEKYYTPKEEDFCLNYEYECRWNKESEWKKGIIFDLDTDRDGMGMGEVLTLLRNYELRTKYLDAEDLKELGWVRYGETDSWFMFNEQYHYEVLSKDKTVRIERKIHYEQKAGFMVYNPFYILFNGICPSKNELKKIMQLCQITH